MSLQNRGLLRTDNFVASRCGTADDQATAPAAGARLDRASSKYGIEDSLETTYHCFDIAS